jgi:hypothetical protein
MFLKKEKKIEFFKKNYSYSLACKTNKSYLFILAWFKVFCLLLLYAMATHLFKNYRSPNQPGFYESQFYHHDAAML